MVDLFISAHNVRQAYYVPYLATRWDKRAWCVTIKSKRRDYIESNHVQDDVSYQVEEMSHVNEVIEVESVSGLQDLKGGVEEVNLASMLTNKKESTNVDRKNSNGCWL